jgi:transglutaminase-like putative cysteine protease
MAFRWLCLGLIGAGLCATAPALAASKPVVAPPPAWVDVAPVPDAPAPDGSPAVQTLLDDNQSRLGPDGDEFYTRRVVKVLRPEGLSDLTTENLTWDPASETLTIHTIAIRRGGKVIDLLKGGQNLLVLRRETGLEEGMLDGRLTASLQVEGLQVGDVFDVAWTLAKRDPITKGRSEDPEGLSSPGVTARYRVRASWPASDPVRWRATDDLPKPVITTKDGRTDLLLDVSNIKAPVPPAGAPARYAWIDRLYGTSYASWNEVSDQIWPLFDQAAQLGPSSDLRAQAAAIAASSTDPKVRAFEALKLVEDKIRYFYIGTNEGGYIPAPADETWKRRFGDCKGKTVVLLALLRQLGVKAEPALVSTGSGDGLDEDLPGLWRFDHVLIRAEIEGKEYWLDGTREGDVGGVDEQEPPAWRWALPLRAGGAPLEEIVQPPLDKPMMDVVVRLDASKGLDAPAPGEFRLTVRGDAAVALRLAVARASKDDLVRLEKQAVANAVSWFEPKDVSWRDEPQDNAFELDITGTADLDWKENADLHMREYRFPSSTGAKLFPERDPASNQNAPFAVAYPLYVSGRTEVVLPNGGKDFQIRGANVAETVGEYHVERSSEIVGGVASFASSLKALAPEAPASAADAANRELRRISDQDSIIRVPDADAKTGA